MEVQACAACRFQRRRCSPSCPLAKYFPASENQRFMNCKKLFGVSNMLRLLNQVVVKDRDETMQSLMFEADVREKDPVHGCMGIICVLEQQLEKMRRELAVVREQLRFFQAQEQQQQQQHQQQREGGAAIDGFHNFVSSSNDNNHAGRLEFEVGVHGEDHQHRILLADHHLDPDSLSSLSSASTSSAVMNAAASFHYCFI